MPRTNHGDHGTKYCNFTYHYNHDYDINVSNMENVEDLQESFQFQRLSMDPNFHAARERSVWHKLRWYYKDTIRPHLTRLCSFTLLFCIYIITVKIQKVSRFCSLLRFTVVCCIFPY